MQDTDHTIAVAIDHGKARMCCFHDPRQELLRRFANLDHFHLCARHHDVANGQLRNLQHALDHGQRLGIKQKTLVRAAKEFNQFVSVVRRA